MFCFQCEQTAGCSACTGKAGVCGKSAAEAELQDELTGALIGMARAAEGNDAVTNATVDLAVDGLFDTVTNVDFEDADLAQAVARIYAERDRLAAAAGVDAPADYDMQQLWGADEDTRSLKSLVLFGIRGMAAYASHARVLGLRDATVDAFFLEALRIVGSDASADDLLAAALKVGQVNLTCMGLLEQGNIQTFGSPRPATVPLAIEPGPFIIVSGHDLLDLKMLLEQTEGTGVSVYTHGEMLPAHGYPELAKYPQLKGNFGTAWQNQRTEFDNVPAPILFTTNCLMPPKASYKDRVFTTGCVHFDGCEHIEEQPVEAGQGAHATKDFGPIIAKALELGGYAERQERTGINGGATVTTGFGRETVLSVADQLIDAVKAGALKHIFLVGGCDGARTSRSYYTDFVKQTPADTAVLTLACGKYRFNDLDLGTIGGLPRLLDMGQCNDAYGAIQVAVALAQAFDCGVNDLPLSIVLSWYEQKAVCILLTLLSLGIKDMYLGPTLPSFVSPNVLNKLVEAYSLHPTSDPATDMKVMLGA